MVSMPRGIWLPVPVPVVLTRVQDAWLFPLRVGDAVRAMGRIMLSAAVFTILALTALYTHTTKQAWSRRGLTRALPALTPLTPRFMGLRDGLLTNPADEKSMGEALVALADGEPSRHFGGRHPMAPAISQPGILDATDHVARLRENLSGSRTGIAELQAKLTGLPTPSRLEGLQENREKELRHCTQGMQGP